jgi:DNA-binding LacI/PurR family transcriptional regulator
MWPPITSLAQPIEDMAKFSAQKIIDWIDTKDREQSHYEFATEIMVRDSCP